MNKLIKFLAIGAVAFFAAGNVWAADEDMVDSEMLVSATALLKDFVNVDGDLFVKIKLDADKRVVRTKFDELFEKSKAGDGCGRKMVVFLLMLVVDILDFEQERFLGTSYYSKNTVFYHCELLSFCLDNDLVEGANRELVARRGDLQHLCNVHKQLGKSSGLKSKP
jgi:hypothetical protein